MLEVLGQDLLWPGGLRQSFQQHLQVRPLPVPAIMESSRSNLLVDPVLGGVFLDLNIKLTKGDR